LAGFEVISYGRFWVIIEGSRLHERVSCLEVEALGAADVEVSEDLVLPAQEGSAPGLELGQGRGREALEEVLEGMGGVVDAARAVEAVEGYGGDCLEIATITRRRRSR
jgi:hypothetical protein